MAPILNSLLQSPGTGTMSATFGSLVLGALDQHGRLVYIGNVGTGFSMAARRALRARLDKLATPTTPFDTPLPVGGRGRGAHDSATRRRQ